MFCQIFSHPPACKSCKNLFLLCLFQHPQHQILLIMCFDFSKKKFITSKPQTLLNVKSNDFQFHFSSLVPLPAYQERLLPLLASRNVCSHSRPPKKVCCRCRPPGRSAPALCPKERLIPLPVSQERLHPLPAPHERLLPLPVP